MIDEDGMQGEREKKNEKVKKSKSKSNKANVIISNHHFG